MSSHSYFQLDVFCHRPGGGNPLGVVVAADDWSSEAMQAFARWTGLVETTFLLAPTTPDASYRVRIFTPQREIAFAGHPSIGSAHAVLEAGIAVPRDGRLVQECQAGLLPVRVEGDGNARQLSVQSPAARVVDRGLDAQVEAGLRMFVYLPFEHSEALADQQRSVALFEALGDAGTLAYAIAHREVIERFGRFPHRNRVLGRTSTPEEQAWLDAGGGFG